MFSGGQVVPVKDQSRILNECETICSDECKAFEPESVAEEPKTELSTSERLLLAACGVTTAGRIACPLLAISAVALLPMGHGKQGD